MNMNIHMLQFPLFVILPWSILQANQLTFLIVQRRIEERGLFCQNGDAALACWLQILAL
jgi:hypothetical protein